MVHSKHISEQAPALEVAKEVGEMAQANFSAWNTVQNKYVKAPECSEQGIQDEISKVYFRDGSIVTKSGVNDGVARKSRDTFKYYGFLRAGVKDWNRVKHERALSLQAKSVFTYRPIVANRGIRLSISLSTDSESLPIASWFRYHRLRGRREGSSYLYCRFALKVSAESGLVRL
ncbi:hypothetical protein EVAR_5065_1 [Eumeta japonica]|uniref:Uncharacterized protein n=1 Tax=Eumeta variegata TaxID=151549 RepID=A0A4C1SWT7_EUMVA|nr:hypothetical protein EVAR_5065_1 [Eumeta japonica]